MSDSSFRRLSGLTEDYADWRRDDKPTTRSLAQIQIKRMAGLLEEGRWMTHLPSFDWDKVERLMEAALAADNVHPRDPTHAHHKESANAHWDARLASAKAHELDKGSDSFTSHKAHGEAAHAHRVAAHLLRSAGDHEFADTHEKWAEHHTTHARAHANTLRGKHGGKPDTGFETEPDPFPPGGDKKPKPKAPPGDLKSPPKKGATSDSEKSAVTKLPSKKPSSFAKKVSAPKEEPSKFEPVAEPASAAEPTKKEEPAAEPAKASSKAHLLKKAGKSKAGLDKEWEKRRKSSKSDHPVVQAGKTAAKAALSGEADDSTSHEELSKLYSHAAKAKLAQAMHHFKSGDHEHALSAFNSALHHTKKADEHKKVGATATKKPTRPWVGKVA